MAGLELGGDEDARLYVGEGSVTLGLEDKAGAKSIGGGRAIWSCEFEGSDDDDWEDEK